MSTIPPIPKVPVPVATTPAAIAAVKVRKRMFGIFDKVSSQHLFLGTDRTTLRPFELLLSPTWLPSVPST
jgi:hypothetical protein